MPRRAYTHRPPCTHEGCPERAYYEFSTRRDYDREVEHLRAVGGWRCVRHHTAGEVLSAEEPVKEVVLEIYEDDFGADPSRSFYKLHKFFTEVGKVAEKKGGNGFKYGPGFKAFAEDFPVGTRLTITARIELPEATDA